MNLEHMHTFLGLKNEEVFVTYTKTETEKEKQQTTREFSCSSPPHISPHPSISLSDCIPSKLEHFLLSEKFTFILKNAFFQEVAARVTL